MTTKCKPRGFGGFGNKGKQGSIMCQRNGSVRSGCQPRKCLTKCDLYNGLEQNNELCNYTIKGGDNKSCCLGCGDILSFCAKGDLGSMVGSQAGKCRVYIDGKPLRVLIREKGCIIPPVPTSDDPLDYTLWKSFMDDLLKVPQDNDLCCSAISGAIDIFKTILQAKLDEDPTFLSEDDPLREILNNNDYRESFDCFD